VLNTSSIVEIVGSSQVLAKIETLLDLILFDIVRAASTVVTLLFIGVLWLRKLSGELTGKLLKVLLGLSHVDLGVSRGCRVRRHDSKASEVEKTVAILRGL
jgi:hypothetical protein